MKKVQPVKYDVRNALNDRSMTSIDLRNDDITDLYLDPRSTGGEELNYGGGKISEPYIIMDGDVASFHNYTGELKCGYFAKTIDLSDTTITKIDSEAFAWWYSNSSPLEKVILPDSLEEIGDEAFSNNDNLIEVVFGENSVLRTIGSKAFRYCSSLEFMNLPNSITEIGSSAFESCELLRLSSLPNGLTAIEDSTFNRCSSLMLTELPDGITKIGYSGFGSCTNLALTKLPDGITEIENSGFTSCENLAITRLPNSLREIGSNAFNGCSSIEIMELPQGITKIDGSAFADCPGVKIEELPESITTMGSYAFWNCTGIEKIVIKSQLLKSAAFYGCSNLNKVWIKETCLTIDGPPFTNCDDELEIWAEVSSKPNAWNANFNKNGSIIVDVTYGQETKPW